MTTTVAKKKAPTRKKAPRPETLREIEELAPKIAELKVERNDIVEQIGNVQDRLLELLDEAGLEEYDYKIGKKTAKVTRVQATPQPVLDEPRLRKKIGITLWNKITTRRVDPNKMKAALANGDLKPNVVAECSIEKPPNAPFVKVTGV